MEDSGELTKKLIDLLARQNATPEEKKVQALIKMALLGDSLVSFVNEVNAATQGFGKVSADTVKRTVEYVKAHNEVQIRNTAFEEEKKELMVAKENNRLMEVEVWILGALAHWGLLG